MILDNFCCIGAELQNREVSQYKAPQLFYYRSANSSETMSVMLTAGFFNMIYQRVKVGDLVLVYEPMNKQLQYIKITSNIGGVVGFEQVAQSTITAEEVPVVPLSPFVSTNLQAMSDEVITKIGQMEIDISGKVSANNSTLTGTTTIASADIAATDTDTLVVNTSTTLSGTTNTESISTTGNISVSGNITAANITASTSMTVPTPVSDSNAATKKYVDDALAGFGGGYHPDLFDFEWTDKLKENMAWLRADTFSWQDGTAYEGPYNHLVDDIAGKTIQTETVAGITIQFYLANDGHKICPASEESNVLALYNYIGAAWYYILDTVNQRFKLPRTKWGFVGYRDEVGKYVPESLPNIKGRLYNYPDQWGSPTSSDYDGALYLTSGVSGGTASSMADRLGTINLDASLSNSTYQNDAPVQQRATQMYLYFYVGNFTQTAIENTAGLNASLFNGKVDTNLRNVDVASGADAVIEFQRPTSDNNYTWYRKYASGWVEQGGRHVLTTSGTRLVNITLPVEMSDTNYIAFRQMEFINSGNSSAVYNNGIWVASGYEKTTTSFYVYSEGNTWGPAFSWEVKGMAAS